MEPPAVTHRESYSRLGNAAVAMLVIMVGCLHFAWMSTSDWRAYVATPLYLWTAFIALSAQCDTPSIKHRPKLVVDAVIACLADDLGRLRTVLDSMAAQTIPPRTLYVIQNGGENNEVKRVFEEWATSPAATKIARVVFWTQAEPDKRQAHELAIRDTDADILLMVDSKTRLDPYAIDEGLRAFGDSKVRSVGGLLIHERLVTSQRSLLARLLGLSFEASYMHDKAAFSRYGSVTVNRGGLAFVRTAVARDILPYYLSEEVAGQRVTRGDDRKLTLAAASGGKTVFQETCVGYIPHPSTLKTASRRYTQWWRTFWPSNLSLLRQFPPSRAIWRLSLLQSIMFVLHALVIPVALIDALVTSNALWPVLGYIVLMGYLRFVRTLAIRRPDQAFVAQAASFVLLAPLTALLELWTYVALMWYGMATVRRTAW